MHLSSSTWVGLVLLLAVAVLLVGCPAFSGIAGSGHAATEQRAVGSFSRVDLSGSADVEVSIGPVQSVEVTLDDNLLPLIETKVEGNTLRIDSTKNYNSSQGMKIKIMAPSLEGFTVSGAANLHVTGLAAKAFSLNISGAGDASLQGNVDALDIHVSGAANIRTDDLTAKQVKVDLSGASSAEVCATESIDASVSGVGSVRYRGHPAQVKQSVSGAGSIDPE